MKTRCPKPTQRENGFSMIEALIAAALIGAVAVGIIPMFSRAISDNVAGSEYTRVSNYAKSEEETFARAPFEQATFQVPVGQANLVVKEYLDPATQTWKTGTVPAGSTASWTRTTTIEQYNLYDSDDDSIYDSPLTGGAGVDAVQFLQATVKVQNVSPTGPDGGHRSTIIRFLKAF
jgi:type II secretory pathway pseudopilin PulG